MTSEIRYRDLGRADLESVWAAMQQFTDTRTKETADEVWFVEHPPVFTLGLNADKAHVLAPGSIPVVQIDRGGQVTYHGPGQQVVYVLLNLKRLGLGIRALVELLENAVIATAAGFGIEAQARRDAPGVYVDGRKLAAVGLRVRRGCSYHGLAVNVNMDPEPFGRINPCGMESLEVTQFSRLCEIDSLERFRGEFRPRLDALLAERIAAA